METNGTRLRLLWSDIHGIERGKYLYGDWNARGRANFCLATFPLTFDREILPIEGLAFDVGLPDLEASIEQLGDQEISIEKANEIEKQVRTFFGQFELKH